MPTTITQKEMRVAATSEKTIEKMKKTHNLLKIDTKDLYWDDINKRKIIDQWYHPLKRNHGKESEDILINTQMDGEMKWRRWARELE